MQETSFVEMEEQRLASRGHSVRRFSTTTYGMFLNNMGIQDRNMDVQLVIDNIFSRGLEYSAALFIIAKRDDGWEPVRDVYYTKPQDMYRLREEIRKAVIVFHAKHCLSF